MKIISVVNYKGGVGKTTFVANIAAKLANEGKRVLLIDLDPQASLTFSFMYVDEWNKKYKDTKTIKNWFDDKLNKRITSIENYIIKDLRINEGYTRNEPLSMICSNFNLFDINSEMNLKIRGGTKRNIERRYVECVFMLKKGLDEIKDKYDFIFLDCQPSFNIMTKNAIVASNYYVIPTKLDNLSTLGINSLLANIEKLVDDVNGKVKEFTFRGYYSSPKLLGVVANMVNKINNDKATSLNENVKEKFKDEKYRLFKQDLRNNSQFMDMNGEGPTIARKANSSTRKVIIKEIEELTIEFEERINEK